MGTAKQPVCSLLDQIPADATFKDIHCHIYVRQKIERGLADIEAGRVCFEGDIERITRPAAESCGDFISDEMDGRGLRRQDANNATFNDLAEPEAFRRAVFAALDRWLVKVEISTRRTPQEMEEYRRPCGE